MAKPVILTTIAERNLERVVTYLLSEWGIGVANNFVNRYEKVIDLLKETPGIFSFFNKSRGIQKCILTKHNILFFHELESHISVITIFDTRQDPGKLNTLFKKQL